jgi:hypothetical protein
LFMPPRLGKIVGKLKSIKRALREWNMTPFCNNFDQVKAAEDRVVEAQSNKVSSLIVSRLFKFHSY